ncbi:MAG: FAD-dependent oxidoreductase [Candidatus Omnitrophota bacterium]
MGKARILILGAGLAGLSAAWHLQKIGIDCHIFEKEDQVGGLCRSKNIAGFCFDYSGHSLHFKNRYIFNLVRSLLGANMIERQRSAWVYSDSRYIPYPFQANLYGLPEKKKSECLSGMLDAFNQNVLTNKKPDNNFLNWIIRTFGKGIAKNFLIPYNTKFWTIAPRQMTCGWIDGFMPVPTISEMIEGAMEDNKREFGYNARFWYIKKGGIVNLPNALARGIKNINTGCAVKKIDLKNKEIILSSGRKDKFDYLISTIPLPELSHILKEMPESLTGKFRKLAWNSIFNLNLGLDINHGLKQHWAYFAQKDISFFRVGYYHNFSPFLTPRKRGSLYIEVSYSKDKPIKKKNLVKRIKSDLRRVGILNGRKVLVEHINDIKYGYPIYDGYYDAARKDILGFLRKKRVIACGRYGSWRYLSMEDVILQGRVIAEELSKCLKKE